MHRHSNHEIYLVTDENHNISPAAATFYRTSAIASNDDFKRYHEVSQDIIVNVSTTTRVVITSVSSPKQSMTNGGLDNWFVFATE